MAHPLVAAPTPEQPPRDFPEHGSHDGRQDEEQPEREREVEHEPVDRHVVGVLRYEQHESHEEKGRRTSRTVAPALRDRSRFSESSFIAIILAPRASACQGGRSDRQPAARSAASAGAQPYSRLKARLNASSESYPTRRATAATPTSVVARRSLARCRRQSVR